MGNLRDANKLRPMKPTDVVLGADEQGCLVNFPPENFSGSIPVNIDTETGDGQELFTEPQVNDYLFKKIKSKDGSTDVITDTDGNIDLSVKFPPFPEIPTVDYPVINGVTVGTGGEPIYAGLENKKIKLPTIDSKTLIIKRGDDTPEGGDSNTIYIDTPNVQEQGLIKSFYVNSNSPGPEYDGTILRPYKTFDAAMVAFKGSGTNINPEWKNRGEIILQTDVSTSINPTSLNGLIIRGDGINFEYTGSDDYMIDSEVLYSQMSFTSPGVMTDNIYIKIYGDINFKRTQKFGLFRCIGTNRNLLSPIPPDSPFVRIDLGNIGDKMLFNECRHSDSLFTENIEYANGTPFSTVYGSPFKASTSNSLKPITPLFYLKYCHSNPSVPTSIWDGKITIKSVSQTNLLLDDYTKVIFNEIDLDFSPERVAYDNTQNVSDYGTYKIYAPHTNRNAFEIRKQTSFFGKIKVERSSGFSHTGFDSFLKIHKDAGFGNFELDYRSQDYVKQFINSSQDNNVVVLGKGSPTIIKNLNIRRLINGNNNTSDLNISMPNTIIYTFKTVSNTTDEFINVNNYGIHTEGSISSINGRPYLTGLIEANDNTDAKNYGKVGALYYDLTGGQNFITQIRP